jgi:ABC-2 type transport system permease protein
MSAMTTATAATPAPVRTGKEPKARFRDLVRSEWTKTRSLRAALWVLGLGVVAVIAANAFIVHSDFPYIDNGSHISRPGQPPVLPYDPLKNGLGNIAGDIFMVIAGGIGALTLSGEYTSGLIRTTLAAVPDRRAAIAAKSAVVAAIMTVAGAVASLGSFFITNAMLASRHVGLSLSSPGCVRAVLAYTLIAPVAALVGVGLAAVIRNPAGSVATLVVLLMVVPEFFGGDKHEWLKKTGEMLPQNALLRLKANPAVDQDLGKYPASITASWIALAAWALVALIVAVLVVDRRDV